MKKFVFFLLFFVFTNLFSQAFSVLGLFCISNEIKKEIESEHYDRESLILKVLELRNAFFSYVNDGKGDPFFSKNIQRLILFLLDGDNKAALDLLQTTIDEYFKTFFHLSYKQKSLAKVRFVRDILKGLVEGVINDSKAKDFYEKSLIYMACF